MNYYSSEDMCALVAEVNLRRIPKICGTMAKRNNGTLSILKNEKDLLVHLRKLHRRFMAGKFTHTDSDESKVKAGMDWLVVQHAANNGQQPRLDYNWDQAALRKSEPVPADTYRNIITSLAEW